MNYIKKIIILQKTRINILKHVAPYVNVSWFENVYVLENKLNIN